MLNRLLKISFGITGLLTGYSIVRLFLPIRSEDSLLLPYLGLYAAGAVLAGVLLYVAGARIMDAVAAFLNRIEIAIQQMTLYELAIDAGGLLIGLVIANLIALPVSKLSFIGVPIAIAANILFGCFGVFIAGRKNGESITKAFRQKNELSASGIPGQSQQSRQCLLKILDTSAIIDGRIAEVCKSGFLDGELIVPNFILEELRHIADSADSSKRNRGRHGLDILNLLQNELGFPIRVEDADGAAVQDVDSELLKMARKLDAQIVTVDFNLSKVACVQGLKVLNLNELANSVKQVAIPGEEMVVQVLKDGKENGQGIGYLDDGTMIVVDGGRKYIGESVSVLVTSVLQTAAGRMIFAKPKFSIERVI